MTASALRVRRDGPAAFDPTAVEAIRSTLAAFASAQVGGGVEIGPLRRFTVGFSWVTYGFRAKWSEGGTAIERDLILRAGPPTGIFGPYHAYPEFVTLKALADSAVPVPRVYWYSDDTSILGAPFFVCDLVPGEAPIPWTHDGGPAFDEERRVRLGTQFVAALAALHQFRWQDTPVASIDGTKDVRKTAAQQVDNWMANLARWSPGRVPMLELAAAWLRENAPVATRISITHGDYRIGNFLEVDGTITAILDWELVRLGDPVEDLGWVCLQAWRGRSPYMCHFFEREELRDRYGALTGHEVSLADMAYWEAFGTFKLAIMHYGATDCFARRGFNDLRMAGMGAQIPRLLLQVETAMERAS
ncbi:phosphotransferase family protein [Mesorhizobium australicum]|uniref:Predicted kinase, aminoglycoside phosphotransferase (APT) family n=1 Tax=Mesorhizobium australicum TaxID=536018 RepID=A0A1X7PLZ0_9HYPH|nr:phosphotransferase family protein [Mesorhizobium australicum]SMH51841.1 Predicted kinase, aminoglycoside phosphotransferase (APT) family [Mesorhizobium australicum]